MAVNQRPASDPVMFSGCSRSVQVCSCGLMNTLKVTGVPWVSVNRRVSAGLWESGVRWQRFAGPSASLSDSGGKSGAPNGNDPSCPADGLG